MVVALGAELGAGVDDDASEAGAGLEALCVAVLEAPRLSFL